MSGAAPHPGGRPGQPESGPETGVPVPRPRPAAGQAALLAMVLSSEDALFRDPFADFIPSSR